ncbi:MAG TPA: FAD-binding protein [Candidatus Binatia bacterium]|nr:FAD-binding protein [Candidatus Binatia bacterium]
MRTVVCVKQVPEVSELALDPVTRRLRREGVPALINPFDRRALLEALRLRDELGGSVTALSMGPPQAEAALRECLGLGVDRAILLCDPVLAGADTLATARALARAIAAIGADLVLAGRYSIDAETAQVPPELAELLAMPFVGGVRRLAVAPAALAGAAAAAMLELLAECELDDGAAEIAVALPALASCTDRWKTRAPIVMPDDERAATGRVETWRAADLGGDAGELGQAGSPTWVADVQAVESARARRRIDARDDRSLAVAEVLRAIAEAGASDGASARGTSFRHARVADPRGAIWVLAERSAAGALRDVSRELLGAADSLAAELSVGIAAAVLDPLPADLMRSRHGDEDPSGGLARDLGRAGADVLLAPGSGTLAPDVAVGALAGAVAELAPRIVLAPSTALGRDVVPQIAARLGLGLTGDAIGVELDDAGRLRQLKPAFGGLVVAPILSRTRPEVATLRPGMLRAPEPDRARPHAVIVACGGGAAGAHERRRWLGFVPEVSEEGASLESARAVVCVGFGLGSAAVARAARLAHLLGGAVGGSRRVCDVGWLPRQAQIGLSGRSVAPSVYLALGVRGSFNHMVGIQRAGIVIAVNRDPDAEVFAGADLGVVADAPSFLEALIAALEGPAS